MSNNMCGELPRLVKACIICVTQKLRDCFAVVQKASKRHSEKAVIVLVEEKLDGAIQHTMARLSPFLLYALWAPASASRCLAHRDVKAYSKTAVWLRIKRTAKLQKRSV